MEAEGIGFIQKRDLGPSALGPKLVEAGEEIAVDRHVLGDLRRDIGFPPVSTDLHGGQDDSQKTDKRDDRHEKHANRYSRHGRPSVSVDTFV